MIDLFNTHRPALFGIAYRMLGRVSEAEDLMQEVWLRWQKQEGVEIQSAKAWLVAATTRLCIDQLRSARHEREEYYGVWLPEPLVEAANTLPDHLVDLTDSLTMAFMMMLETLGPVERAVFLLHEVFDYSYAETATIVGKTEVNCRQIIRRSKASLLTSPTPPQPPNEQARRVVEQFAHATSTGQIDQLLDLLMEDVTVYSDGGGKVKAAGLPIRNADRVSRFLIGIRRLLPADMACRFATVNGKPGMLMISGGQIYGAYSFDLIGERVRNVYGIWNPEKLRHLAR
ncbi:RNA polymerase sigma-70 factor, partial [Prosthecobacter sp.]|uniref:RNA polymerase sigma-70 factor n=1 Tax=Prosthecobacter sp. TaxID=1965333 RepID=UPI002487A6DA